MAMFGYVSPHSANGSASSQNLVDNKESRDQSIIYWPDKRYTCTNEGGCSVLILRRPGFLQSRAAALILRWLSFFTYIKKPPGMIPYPTSSFGRVHFDPARTCIRR